MDLVLDSSSGGPLHERIAATLRRAMAEGRLLTGTRLPTAQALAEQFGVNVNTVLRAYRQLSAENLLDLRPGRGAVVSGDLDHANLYRLADELLAEAARLGMTRGELAALLVTRS